MTASMENLRPLQPANPNTIQDKFLVGYQGWFTCAGDGAPIGPGHHGWLHWMNDPITAGGYPNTDLWPDVSTYSREELFPIEGLEMQDGNPPMVFSSRHPKTVHRHFRWMAEHGVDGVFLQRFAGQCDLEGGNHGIRRLRDEIGDRVREAAEREGRVFAIMYDVTDVPHDRIQRIIEQDWMHLVHNKRILDSPNYLKEKGRPVISLWGFGFSDRAYTPRTIYSIVQFIRHNTPGGAYIVAGVPAHWRTCTADAHSNPEFVGLFLNEFDAISPWTIGRYNDEDSADRFAEEKMKGDMELIRQRNQAAEMAGSPKRVDYIPVLHPGGSGHNLSQGKWKFNDAKRNGGKYLWRQIWNARRQGVRIMYGAMWDEYDEGTAFLPVVSHKRQLPKSDKWQFLALDAEGHDLPSDWYMRICGFAAEGLRSERMIHETFPVKELQDYWSSRPRYVADTPAAQASSSAVGSSAAAGDATVGDASQAYQNWLASENARGADSEEPPPPPYTLEAEEQEPPTTSIASQSTTSSGAPLTGPQPVSNTRPTPSPSSTLPPQPQGSTYPGMVAGAVPSLPSANTRPQGPTSPQPQMSSYPGMSTIAGTPSVPPSSTRPQGTSSPTLSYNSSYPGMSGAPSAPTSSYPNMHTSYPGMTMPGGDTSSFPPTHPAHATRPTPSPSSTLGPQPTSSYPGMVSGTGAQQPTSSAPHTSSYPGMASSSPTSSLSGFGNLVGNFAAMNMSSGEPSTSPRPVSPPGGLPYQPSYVQGQAAFPQEIANNGYGHPHGSSNAQAPSTSSHESPTHPPGPNRQSSYGPSSQGGPSFPGFPQVPVMSTSPVMSPGHISPAHTGGSSGSGLNANAGGSTWSQAQWPPADWQGSGTALGRKSSAQAQAASSPPQSMPSLPGAGLGRTSSATGVNTQAYHPYPAHGSPPQPVPGALPSSGGLSNTPAPSSQATSPGVGTADSYKPSSYTPGHSGAVGGYFSAQNPQQPHAVQSGTPYGGTAPSSSAGGYPPNPQAGSNPGGAAFGGASRPPSMPPRPAGGQPPQVPPRPGNVAQELLTSMPMNMALGAVERFGSQDRRRQVEKGVEDIAKVGSKLFSRFTK